MRRCHSVWRYSSFQEMLGDELRRNRFVCCALLERVVREEMPKGLLVTPLIKENILCTLVVLSVSRSLPFPSSFLFFFIRWAYFSLPSTYSLFPNLHILDRHGYHHQYPLSCSSSTSALANPVGAPPKTVTVCASFAIQSPLTLPLTFTKQAYKCKNGGTVKLSNIKNNLSAAPVAEGKSGYPHAFQNLQKFPMDERCHNKILLEMPIFPNGKNYNFNSKPKEDPGPIRAIFSNPGKLLCNVIAHIGPGNTGDFEECEPLLS